MNINNNFSVRYNNTKSFFSGMKKEKPKMRNKKEQMEFLTDKVCKHASDRIEKEVPENGMFTKVIVAWDVPETQNEAMLIIEHDALNPKSSRRLSVNVHRSASDRTFSNYILKGTKQEILDYVRNPDNREEIIKSANNLSDSVDKYYIENF